MKPLSVVAIAVLFTLSACNRPQNQAATGDPANGDLAPADQPAAAAPATDASTNAPTSAPDEVADASAQEIQAPDPPPPIPEYSQPPCPGDGYEWTPGYWDYGNAGYYWVPGAWLMAPYVGALWTPPWWGFENGVYLRHAGYWGPHIGFYGGINYGFGYTGRGYYGAYWRGRDLFYNRSVTNVNTSTVHNVYNYSVSSAHGERVSYNGGHGGGSARPTAQETAALRDRRTAPVAAQIQQARAASADRQQFSAGGHTKPANLVTEHPLATEYRAPAERAPEAHPTERPQPVERPTAPSSAERMRQPPEQQPAPAQQPFAPEARPGPREQRTAPARPAAPEAGPQPESHANRGVRPESRPRPVPQEHAAPQPHPAQPQHETPHPTPPPEKKKGQ
jgi:hypothetical protein